jgi:predicted transposase/invertase (TIGR01784 family)
MGRLIRLDWAIQKILRDKANFGILEGFLSELLGFDVHILEVLESEGNRAHARDKFNRVDLLARDEQDQLYIIEVQNESETDYLQRLMYGTSKAMVEHIQGGVPYAELKKIFSVSIVYFDLGSVKITSITARRRFRG